MAKNAAAVAAPTAKKKHTWVQIKRNKWMYFLLLPGVLFFIIFKIVPLWGIFIAMKNYYAGVPFMAAEWVGLDNFIRFFSSNSFLQLLRNTLIISGMNIVFYFPLPIILALLLNEIRVQWYKKVLQTLVYVPHFVSMVVIASITFMLLKESSSDATTGGAIFEITKKLTGTGETWLSGKVAIYWVLLVQNIWKETGWGTIIFLAALAGETWLSGKVAIYWVLLVQNIWKETGWGTIIFLAALAGVDVEQYEAAIVDGATRFQQLIYITLPAIFSTIVTMFILRMGSVLDTGFEQIILMQNSLNMSSTDTFDTYVYNIGRVDGNYGYSTAVGLFKSVVSLICIQVANRLAKKAGQSGLF